MATLKNTTYARRDSATARLRKLGVASKDYNHYIARTDEGFLCKLEEIPPFGADESTVTKPTKKPKDAKKKAGASAKKTSTPSTNKLSMAQFCRERILNGERNDTIFAALQEEFGERISENQKHYPAWFRCQLRRKGELPPAYDFPNHPKDVVRSEED